MYRRRRPQREKIAFSFDSFLDLVANVIGIIIRLILVTWVGARSYSTTMQWLKTEPPAGVTVPALPPPRAEDDPASKEVEQARKEIEAARARLLEQLRQLEVAQSQQAQVGQDLEKLKAFEKDLEREKVAIAQLASQRGQKAQFAALSLEDLRKHGKTLLEQIKSLEKLPTPTKALRFQTPVSRPIRSDEVFFECRSGKVTYIDLAAFNHEMRDNVRDKVDALRTQWEVSATTAPVGAFRMRYVIERERDYAEALAPGGAPPRNASFSYGLSRWELEPITENRGETAEAALKSGSYFRQIAEGLDSQQAVITLWVYPDSFGLFRQLRDYLHGLDIEVAGRPIPFGVPITASRYGTHSRGQ